MPVYAEQKFMLDQFTGKKISDVKFYACDFSETDLTETQFVNCHFWHPDKQVGCDFSGATLKEASFVNCDLTMSIFKNADLFGIEIRECRAMGCNFRQARFMKKISPRLWLCSAYITKSNLSYADFSGTVAKLAMRQPFVLFKGLTFQKLCLPGAFRPGDHHNKMLRPGLCVVHASPQYL
ncbi:TPA: pentapeptide repeat-containing protein [Salmonella enterica]|nr:pentapeptide repeat-containing protein [Salmonella enterica]HCH9111285.1 pentapeptide repeat-containing protein [Salmonella enterica]